MRVRGLVAWAVVAVLGTATSCGGASAERDSACETDCGAATGAADGVDDGDGDGVDDTGAADDGADGGGTDDPDGGDDGTSSSQGIPCDVQDVLAANCWTCHGDSPAFGAPMSLTSIDDFMVPATSDATRPVYELVGERINSDTKPMPADGSLSDADRGVLSNWVAAASPVSDEECDDPNPPDDPPGVGPDELPCEVTHTFTAHSTPGSTDPFHVPLVDNLYQCFTFASPLTSTTEIAAWAPIVDDERVLHHWILYHTTTPQTDGGVGPCNMPGDASFLAGWAPGGQNFVLPDDVGLEFGGPDSYFILQMHYNNTGGYDDALDNSGVAFCATPPREQTAGVIWLGSFDLSIPAGAMGHEETGTCPSLATNLLPGPLNVIASFPHMHELGRRLQTEVYRGGAGGPMEVMVDADPFQFSNQVMYPHDPPFVINPGDELLTHCWYDNTYGVPVNFGENTEDEMWFNFIMGYPINGIPAASRECTF